MKKKWILIYGILIIIIAIVSIVSFYFLGQQGKECQNNDDCRLVLDSCSCSYFCGSKLLDYKSCALVCGNVSVPPGPEPKCVCKNYKCVSNLD